MAEIMMLKEAIEKFDSIVMLYKNENNEIFLGHSFFYNGREDSKYLLFLYRSALKNDKILESWNDLDENSLDIAIVGTQTHELAIEDFLHAHKCEVGLDEVYFIEIDLYSEIEKNLKEVNFSKNQVFAFFMKK